MHKRYKAKSDVNGLPMSTLMYLDLEKIHAAEKGMIVNNTKIVEEFIEKQKK